MNSSMLSALFRPADVRMTSALAFENACRLRFSERWQFQQQGTILQRAGYCHA